MSFDQKRTRGEARPPCGELGPDDGIDPRILFRQETRLERSSSSDDRKLSQLCAQVARAVQFALSGQCNDERLQSVDVLRVEPAPDARRLRVVVCCASWDAGSGPTDPGSVARRLTAARGLLRTAVAASIRRRKTPELTFLVVPGSDRHGEASS